MIIIKNGILPKLLKKSGYNGMSFFVFIIIAEGSTMTKSLLLHETIHFKQQLEMLFIFQWLWYLIEYLIRRIQYKDHDSAYRNISFEREAYANDNNFNYLKTRKLYSWIKYIWKQK